MDFRIEDTRKNPKPKVNDLIKDGSISLEDATDWLRSIYEIRFFEEKVFDLLGQNIIKGASHLYAGEEAVAVGATAAIERGDVIGSTHRGHGHCGAIGNKYTDVPLCHFSRETFSASAGHDPIAAVQRVRRIVGCFVDRLVFRQVQPIDLVRTVIPADFIDQEPAGFARMTCHGFEVLAGNGDAHDNSTGA